jgi:hypothetical protein
MRRFLFALAVLVMLYALPKNLYAQYAIAYAPAAPTVTYYYTAPPTYSYTYCPQAVYAPRYVSTVMWPPERNYTYTVWERRIVCGCCAQATAVSRPVAYSTDCHFLP